jgi:hypothetical protein
LERFDDLKPTIKDNDYILEGVCAIFGVMNENKRVYEKADYLPHLIYLNEKISKNKLTGELDHPEKLEGVTLKNSSHIIEKLWYDEASNSVRIKIRLLNTPSGQIARKLVDDGVTLSISSRAAGQVTNEGRVNLLRILTYDLVAEPGFAQAVLSRPVKESLKQSYETIYEGLNTIKLNSVINKLQDISESYNFGENVKIYKINEKDEALAKLIAENPIQKNVSNMLEFVTEANFEKYSQEMSKQFNTLTDKLTLAITAITSLKEAKEDEKDKSVEGAAATEETTELPNLSDADSSADTVQKLIIYVNYLTKQINALIKFGNYQTEKLNHGILYTEKIGRYTNAIVNFTNMQSKKISEAVTFANSLSTKLNEGLNYNDYNTTLAKELADQQVAIAEKVNLLIDYIDLLGEKQEQGTYFSNYLARKMKENITTPAKVNEGTASVTDGTKISIKEQVNTILTEIRSKSQEAVLEQRHPFLKLLTEAERTKFYALDMDTKGEVVSTLNSTVYMSGADVMHIVESVIAAKNANVPTYVKFMPDTYKPVYEKMNEGEKQAIAGRASMVKINTPYQAKTFWDTLDLRNIKERLIAEQRSQEIANNQAILESQGKEGFIPSDMVQTQMRGYSLSFVEDIKRFGTKNK